MPIFKWDWNKISTRSSNSTQRIYSITEIPLMVVNCIQLKVYDTTASNHMIIIKDFSGFVIPKVADIVLNLKEWTREGVLFSQMCQDHLGKKLLDPKTTVDTSVNASVHGERDDHPINETQEVSPKDQIDSLVSAWTHSQSLMHEGHQPKEDNGFLSVPHLNVVLNPRNTCFQRGQHQRYDLTSGEILCQCDSLCVAYDDCCHDYHGKSTWHYGTKPGNFETSKIHFPTSEGVSKVSERANE